MIPGIKNQRPHTKEEVQAFYEAERNCNTCRHLKRVKHEKDKAGFLYGHCLHHPYGDRFVMMFHPDDPMHMRCYEPRPTK